MDKNWFWWFHTELLLIYIKKVLVCSTCKSQIDSKAWSFELNIKENDTLIKNPTCNLFFCNMLLVVGARYMEKNLLLAVFRLSRKFIIKLEYKLHLGSKRAIEYIVNWINYHLSWQISAIVYKPFLVLFRVSIFSFTGMPWKKEKSTPNHLTDWPKNEVKNASYHLYYDLTFNFFLGLKCFGASIRHTNSLFACDGCHNVAPIMFIVIDHMIYCDIVVNDTQIRVEDPDDINRFITQNESSLGSRDNYRGKEVTTLPKMKTCILEVIYHLGYLH